MLIETRCHLFVQMAVNFGSQSDPNEPARKKKTSPPAAGPRKLSTRNGEKSNFKIRDPLFFP